MSRADRVVRMIWCAGLAAVIAAAGAQVIAQSPESAAGRAQRATSASHGTPSEGITIHGHWAINIRNRDGSLAQHREIDNSLDSYGAQNLALLLTGARAAGRWAILLNATVSGHVSPCPQNALATAGCLIVEAGTAAPLDTEGPGTFLGLTVTQPSINAVQLRGRAVAQVAGNIDAVASLQGVCQRFTAPGSCLSPNAAVGVPAWFSSASVTGQSVGVAPAQIIEVTVTFSFS